MSAELALVEARLGRPPQDMLEAAVALEAWAGVPAQRALESGALLMRGPVRAPLASAAVPAPAPRRPELLVEGLAFIASVLAIALWAAPLADALGAAAVGRALTVALPLTLALQWGLRSRYLSRPRGLAELARVRAGAALGLAAVAVVPWLVLGAEGAVAGLLTVTWTAGTVLMRRGWAPGYAAIVLAATAPMAAGVAPLPLLGATAAVTLAAAAAALRAPAAGDRATPGRWGRAGACALLGAGLGTLLVADPSTGWSTGATPALALLPSAVAGIWAGERLWRIDHAIPRALAGIPAVGAAAPRRLALPAPVGILLGAVARLAGASLAGSLLLALFVPVAPGLLAAFALLALATLLVGLLEAMGRTGAAALGVACALAAELAPFAGAGLVAGAAVGVAVLLPAAIAPLSRPARTLATTLWIA